MIRDYVPILRGRLVLAVLLLVANVLAFAAGLLPAADRVLNRDARLARLEARRDALELAERTRRIQAESRKQVEAFVASFPPRAEILAVTDRIQAVAAEFDVTVPAVEYRPDARPTEEAPLTRVTIAMNVEGPYRELRRLLHALERQRNHLVIERAALRKRSGESGVQLALELSAYFR